MHSENTVSMWVNVSVHSFKAELVSLVLLFTVMYVFVELFVNLRTPFDRTSIEPNFQKKASIDRTSRFEFEVRTSLVSIMIS